MHGHGGVCLRARLARTAELPAGRPARSEPRRLGPPRTRCARVAAAAATVLLVAGHLQGALGQAFWDTEDGNPSIKPAEGWESVNTDPWEVWSARPGAPYGAEQNLKLVEGELRHTIARHDFEAFKRVLSEQGCSSNPAPASCNALLHHGDADGRSIYHLIGKYGYGGDYLVVEPPANGTGYYSPDALIEKQLLHADWRSGSAPAGSADVSEESLFLKVYRHSADTLGIAPQLNLRDISGQTPLHEAALHGRVLTIRAMVNITNKAVMRSSGSPYDADGFLRAQPLRREWSYGWTMMNVAAMSVRDSARRQAVKSAMQVSMENVENFAETVTKGMTIMDYAAINGHAEVVDYLGYLEDNSRGAAGIAGLGTARSNWNEAPVQKAITLGHVEVVEVLIKRYGCDVMRVVSEGGETVLHNAVASGSAHILRLMKEECPVLYQTKQKERTKLNTKRYLWTEETPCLLSQTVLEFINKNEFGQDRKEFPEGFQGYHRYRCTHNPHQSCLIDTDCQATSKDGVDARCDLSQGAVFNVYDLLHHFEACRLVCEGVDPQLEKACGPEISSALKLWLTGEPNHETAPYGPRHPDKGPPEEWAAYRADPFNWFINKQAAEAAEAAGGLR